MEAEAVSSEEVQVRWEEVAAASGYKLERRETPDGAYGPLAAVVGTSYADSGVAADTGYGYRVRSVLTRGSDTWESAWSAAAAVTTPVREVGNLTAAAVSSVQIDLAWDEAATATGYQLRWRVAGGDWSDPLAAGTATAYEHPGRNPETTYEYAARTLPAMGTRGWGDAVSVTTPALEVPQGVEAELGTAGAAVLSWDAVGAADSYEVQRRETPDGAYASLGTVTATSYADSGLAAGRSYEYQVRSLLTRGTDTWESAWSDAAAVSTPAPAVANLTAEAVSSGQIDLEWDAAMDAIGYELRWRVPAGDWSDPPLAAGTATSYEHGERNPETTYEYAARSLPASGDEGWGDEVSVTTPALEVPTGLAVAIGAGSFLVTWDEVEAASGYELRRKEMSEAAYGSLGAVAEARYEDEDLETQKTYDYQVRSVLSRAGRQWESDWSAAVRETLPRPPRPAALEPPTGLTATATSASSVEVEWDEISYAESYEVGRQPSRGAEVVTAVSGTSLEDTRLTPATTYAYRVRTLEGGERSPWSATVSVTTRAPPGVQNLTAEAVSSVQIDLEWDAAMDATGYELRWRVPAGDWSDPPLAAGTATSYEHTGRNPETTYEYAARSLPASGDEGWGDAVSVTTPALEVPTGLAVAIGAGSFLVTWDEVAAASGYELRRKEMSEAAYGSLGALAEARYEDEDLETQKTYDYQVRSVLSRAGRQWESDWSAAVRETLPRPPRPATLEPPTGLTATATSAFSVELEWDEISYAESYEVGRQPSGGAEVVTAVSGTSLEDTGLDPRTSYTYRVRSLEGGDRSVWSATVSVTTDAPPPPENLSAVPLSWLAVHLRWDEPPGAGARYRVRLRIAETGDWEDYGTSRGDDLWASGVATGKPV